MDFWGYPSDLCLFADNNPKTPLQMMKNKNQQKTRHLIFYILVFYFILFLHL